MGRFADSFNSTCATPTLRGLRVDAKSYDSRIEPGELWPWDRVEDRGEHGYQLLDSRGEAERRERRSVHVRVRGINLQEVARRAQSRALRHALSGENVRIRFRFKNQRLDEWMLALVGAVSTGGFAVLLFWIAAHPDRNIFHVEPGSSDDLVFLTRCMLIGMLLLLALPGLILVQAIRALRCNYVVRAAFTHDKLRVVRRDRSRAIQRWSDLHSINGRTIFFNDGTSVFFKHLSRRVDRIIYAISHNFLGWRPTGEANVLLKMTLPMLRTVSITCIVCGIVLFRASSLFAEPDHWLWLWLVPTGAGMMVVLAPAGGYLFVRVGRWIAMRARHKERANRAAEMKK